MNPSQKFTKLGRITTPFGVPTRQEKVHGGVDIANAEGTPISAPVGGVVVKTDEGHSQGENNYGNTLEVKDPSGRIHQFHHLQNMFVRPGQRVNKGQKVATMGKTGAVYSENGSDPTNLDYRIVDVYGKFLNPQLFINDL